MIATKAQKQHIYKLCGYRKETKEEYVQWATDSNDKTSTNDLTFNQANKIITQLNGKPHTYDNWAFFDKTNKQHKYIMSLLHQMGWTTTSDRYGAIPDLKRLSDWLQTKSPVTKRLKSMNDTELTKTINALEIILGKLWKKRK